MQIAYKAFTKDLEARCGTGNYVFSTTDWNIEKRAQCVEVGLHAALNPLDCMQWYSWDGKNRFFQVLVDGDSQIDGYATRLSCTKLKLVKELTASDMVLYSMQFVYEHPTEPLSNYIAMEKGTAENTYCSEPFVIVYGKNPKARGCKGSVCGLIQVDDNDKIIALDMFVIDGKQYKANKYYGLAEE